MTIRLIAVIASVVLLGAGCAGTDDASAAGSDDPAGTAAGGGDATGTDELLSVFPLPSGSISEVESYVVSDDGETRTETASYLMAGATQDSVVGYYQAILGDMGYVLSDPVAVGTMHRVDISDPADATISALIEVDEHDAGILISQTRTQASGG